MCMCLSVVLYICRLSYGVFLIDSLLEKYSFQKVNIMYDVTCTFHKVCQVNV